LGRPGGGGHESVIAIVDAPAPDNQRWQPPAPPALHAARTFRHGGFAPWWIASYTALTRRMSASTAQDFDDNARELEAADGDAPEPFHNALTRDDVRHAFPRGADAGTVLHDLLQWCARQGFAHVLADPTGLRELAARRLAVRGWTDWLDPLCDWLREFLDIPLPLLNEEQSLRLSGLEQTLGEMEFWLPVRHLDTARLDTLITAHIWPGQERPPLGTGVLAGMIRGYVDLSFAHADRYWVLDYKSHWLGPNAAAYAPSALRAVMLAHRYDVQAALYLLALHRLLRARLPGYDPQQHLGGAAYCFLRGNQAQGRGLITLQTPCALIEALDAALPKGVS
jgi:exodeoxyribonuclease V beta subunit